MSFHRLGDGAGVAQSDDQRDSLALVGLGICSWTGLGALIGQRRAEYEVVDTAQLGTQPPRLMNQFLERDNAFGSLWIRDLGWAHSLDGDVGDFPADSEAGRAGRNDLRITGELHSSWTWRIWPT